MRTTARRRIEFAVVGVMCCLATASDGSGLDRGDPLVRRGASSIRVVAEALSWQGVTYRYGGRTRKGVDCSGFVHEVLAKGIGGEVPTSSQAFANFGEKVEGDIEPGDLVLFGKAGRISHVGIALSPEAFIHAASEGGRTGVIISKLDESAWRRSLLAVRRPVGEGIN